jgi:universal stress protein family protein
MKEQRWLLPFTHGVNMQAIDFAVSLAQNAGARLLAVSLVSIPQESRSSGARLEHIQQSKDFLEAVKWKAARYEVPIERYEVFTSNVLQSITLLVDNRHCDSIILVTSGKKDVLLEINEVKRLFEAPPTSLVLIRRQANAKRLSIEQISARFLVWLQHFGWQQEDTRFVQNEPAEEEPSWIRAEEHQRG